MSTILPVSRVGRQDLWATVPNWLRGTGNGTAFFHLAAVPAAPYYKDEVVPYKDEVETGQMAPTIILK
jgi:hypothetical protein